MTFSSLTSITLVCNLNTSVLNVAQTFGPTLLLTETALFHTLIFLNLKWFLICADFSDVLRIDDARVIEQV